MEYMQNAPLVAMLFVPLSYLLGTLLAAWTGLTIARRKSGRILGDRGAAFFCHHESF